MKAILAIIMLTFLSLPLLVTTVSARVITTPEGVIITHYPTKFDGVGTVHHVSKEGISVNDVFYPFASRVRYMTPHSIHSSLGSFEEGQKVGYMLNDKRQITKLCLFLRTRAEILTD